MVPNRFYILVRTLPSGTRRRAVRIFGGVGLEYASGTLVFNADVGDQDVQVDAGSGALL